MPKLTLKRYMEGAPLKEAEVTSTSLVSNSELDDLFNDLLADIDQQVDDLLTRLNLHFHSSVQKAAQFAINDPTSKTNATNAGKLPWFKNGIRGFVNKLWHGDHASNPNWKTSEHTLQDYMAMESVIGEEVDWLIQHNTLAEEENPMADLAPVLNDFKSRLAKTIQRYMFKARTLASTPAPNQPSSTEPSISNDGSVDPTIQAASERWYASKNISPKTRQAVGAMLGKNMLIKNNRRQEAINFMKENGLDPNEPDQVRIVWPRHRHEPIAPVTTTPPTPTAAAAAAKEPLGPPKAVATAPIKSSEDIFDHLDRKAAAELLEGTSFATKKSYYKTLIAHGLH